MTVTQGIENQDAFLVKLNLDDRLQLRERIKDGRCTEAEELREIIENVLYPERS